MRGLTRNVATLAIAAGLVLAGTIIATSALGSTGGDSTGPGPSTSPGHVVAVATTNTAPVPTFQPSPAGSIFVPITPCRTIDTRVSQVAKLPPAQSATSRFAAPRDSRRKAARPQVAASPLPPARSPAR